MTQPNKKRYKLSEIVTKVRMEKPTIEIETDNGQVFEIDPPELWPDEALQKSQTDPIGAAKLIVKDYAKFVKAGGSAALAMQVVAHHAGIDTGK